jgi:hypothetical protein
MNVVWALIIIVVVTGAAVTAMQVVRRRAPVDGWFTNGDRASGVFGVLATGFSVLLGFLIFLAFESYDASRVGAEAEAVTVAQQIETAQLLPAEVRGELTGGLVCYARYVIEDEWEQMESGAVDAINPWGVAMFQAIEGVEPGTAAEEAAYGLWLDQTSVRQEARQQRLHGAEGIIPSPLWWALFLITAVIAVYLLCFADSGEGRRIQGLLIGSVVAAITTMLLVLAFLNDPYTDGVGGLEPHAMERTIDIIDAAVAAAGIDVDVPCDAAGQPA